MNFVPDTEKEESDNTLVCVYMTLISTAYVK